MFPTSMFCEKCGCNKDFCDCGTQERRAAARKKKAEVQLLTQFAAYLNERCDIDVANMVRPFMEGNKDA